MPDINIWAVLIAALAFWILGAVWYGVFGRAWMACLKLKEEDLDPKNPIPYVLAYVGSALNALALAVLFALLKPSIPQALLWGSAAAVLTVGGAAAKHYAFSCWPAKLFAIDFGMDLVGFVMMSLILTLWPPAAS